LRFPWIALAGALLLAVSLGVLTAHVQDDFDLEDLQHD
jgi:hypothetical protein